MESVPLELEEWSPNHWTARKVPGPILLVSHVGKTITFVQDYKNIIFQPNHFNHSILSQTSPLSVQRHFLSSDVCVLSCFSCVRLFVTLDCRLPGSSVHGISNFLDIEKKSMVLNCVTLILPIMTLFLGDNTTKSKYPCAVKTDTHIFLRIGNCFSWHNPDMENLPN